jgi:hypothetical protein
MVELWIAGIGAKEVTTSDLIKVLDRWDGLKAIGKGTPHGAITLLGKLLNRNRDRIVCGHKIRTRTLGGTSRWWLVIPRAILTHH